MLVIYFGNLRSWEAAYDGDESVTSAQKRGLMQFFMVDIWRSIQLSRVTKRNGIKLTSIKSALSEINLTN